MWMVRSKQLLVKANKTLLLLVAITSVLSSPSAQAVAEVQLIEHHTEFEIHASMFNRAIGCLAQPNSGAKVNKNGPYKEVLVIGNGKGESGRASLFDLVNSQMFGQSDGMTSLLDSKSVSWISTSSTITGASKPTICNRTLANVADMNPLTHKMSSTESSKQLIVLANDPDTLLHLLRTESCKTDAERALQLRRSYWSTFERVVLAFATPQSSSKAVEALTSFLHRHMDSNNILVLLGAEDSTKELRKPVHTICNWKYLCFHCCRNTKSVTTKTCLVDVMTTPSKLPLTAMSNLQLGPRATTAHFLDHENFLSDPEATSFNGNFNRFVVQTETKNLYRSFFNSGSKDNNGKIVYKGPEFEVFDLLAEAMNYSYNIRIAASAEYHGMGELLSNGSWTGFIGETFEDGITDEQ